MSVVTLVAQITGGVVASGAIAAAVTGFLNRDLTSANAEKAAADAGSVAYTTSKSMWLDVQAEMKRLREQLVETEAKAEGARTDAERARAETRAARDDVQRLQVQVAGLSSEVDGYRAAVDAYRSRVSYLTDQVRTGGIQVDQWDPPTVNRSRS